MAEVNKQPNFFVRTGRRFTKWLREMKSELKKVVWPSGRQLVNNTLVVLAVAVLVGIVIWTLDALAGLGIDGLGSIFKT